MAERKEEKVDNPFLKRLGARLKALKEESGLSYRKIATNCDIDYANIKMYEKGETNIQLLTIAELAKGYGKHPKKILEFDWGDDYPRDEEEILKEKVVQLEAYIERMDADNKSRAIEYSNTISDLEKQLAEKEKEIKQLLK